MAGNALPHHLWLRRQGEIAGDLVAEANASIGTDGKPVIVFTLTPQGRDRFAVMTRDNIGHRLAVVVAGKIVMAPVVRTEMAAGKGEISGNYTVAEARRLAAEMTGTNNTSHQ